MKFHMIAAVWSVLILVTTDLATHAADLHTTSWISALDQKTVQRIGTWNESSFRYSASRHLITTQDKAALEVTFQGTGIAIRLAQHAVPAYGRVSQGMLEVTIDGMRQRQLRPLATAREIVLAKFLSDGPHKLRLEHATYRNLSGCRIEGFRVLKKPSCELQFHVNGEQNAFLVDVRAVLRQGDRIVRNALARNWMTGQCCVTGLPAGTDYSLQIKAIGWRTVQIDGITFNPDQPTTLPPVYLQREVSTVISRFRFPALNRQAICRPSESFRARFLGFNATIDHVRLTRRVGPAVISRTLKFEEDKSAAYYYDREVVAHLPDDIPAGTYDLSVQITGGRRTGICRSPASVHVVSEYPIDPVFLTFGHLDTSSQYQAEYLERLMDMANLIAPDMVLNANAVNPAYISGAMSRLDVPYLINFGNHQFPGHEAWYGDPTSIVDFGPRLSILNFGHPWHVDTSKADALFAARKDVSIKVINAFEQNAPLKLLDTHRVCMIHDAHGTGKKVMDMGATPTRRIGKTNAVSFRVVRLKNGRVDSCTYGGHETAPYPFGREQTSPLRVEFSPANDGSRREVTAAITNDFVEDFPRGRVTFVLPFATYKVDRGTIESQTHSDDAEHTVVSVRVDIPKQQSIRVRVEPR